MRHLAVRSSGTILGTAAGTAAVAAGIAASASADLVVAAVFVHGIWWWTVGKMWLETRVMPRPLGIATLGFGAAAIATAVLSAPVDVGAATVWGAERLVLGSWGLAMAVALWRAA